jgi:restriction endonuclease S subunit
MNDRHSKIETNMTSITTSIKTMSVLDKFKSAVTRIRDILRGPGTSITGMDSMRHICLYLMSRYMTRAKIASLEVPATLCWENFMELIRSVDGGTQKALDLFYHPEVEDCLIKHFDRLFGTTDFPFSVKNLQKHKEILEILDTVNMEAIDCQIDILGYVYEEHLRTGSSAARDLGQFFTDRFICEYMTELCKPGFKSPGVPESVCDPSMGTGGFLTAFIKYYKKHHVTSPINWRVQEKEIHGCDTDSKVAGVARLNLFMEIGMICGNLLTHDSLYGDLTRTGYDVILANMPFGLKGIKHADCCERVKALKIRGTKSEPLFLQLMMVSLNKGGRCAVVVPDGMLINSSECHNGTRKYLLEHFELKRIIKMKGQFFMNTGIQPSILFFENTGKPTAAVEFWDLIKDDQGLIIEKMIVSVPQETILAEASISFNPYRYLETKADILNAANYPVVKLSDICNYENGKMAEKAADGIYDIMGGGTSYMGKTSKFNREGPTITISKSGTAGYVAFHNKKFWAGDCFTIQPKDGATCNIKYLYYFLKLNNHLTMSATSGSTIPHCKWDDIKNIQIILPPNSVQTEIVHIIDRIYSPGTNELEEAVRSVDNTSKMVADIKQLMIDDIKMQMKAILNAALKSSNESLPMFDIADIECGEYITKKTEEAGDYPVYGGGGVSNWIKRHNREPTMVINKDGMSEKCVQLVNTRFFLNHHGWTLKLRNEKLIEKFLHWQLYLRSKEIYGLATGSCQKGLNQKEFNKFMIQVIPVEQQKKIVAIIEDLQAQLNALKSMQKGAEEKARFILESYLGSCGNEIISIKPAKKGATTA